MPSKALEGLETGVEELERLLEADPTPQGGLSPQPEVTRAVLRAAVVLLAGHLEAYIRNVVGEAIDLVNENQVNRESLTERLRLQHARASVRKLVERDWTHWAGPLSAFVRQDGWLWDDLEQAPLDPTGLLTWMKSPTTARIKRAYDLWGVSDIFKSITRKHQTRWDLVRRLDELVDKRNKIAHGEFGVDATPDDIRSYQKAVCTFSRRADAFLARVLKRDLFLARAW